MFRSVLLLMLLIINTSLGAQVLSSSTEMQPGAIVAYYDKDWQLVKNEVAHGFYRQLIKIEANGYRVQDFYVDTKTKQTDAFLVTHKDDLTANVLRHQDVTLTTWYPTGEKKEQYIYQKGMLLHLVMWHINGVKRYEGDFNGRDKQGLWTGWYTNGQKGWQGNFVANQSDGEWRYWYANGQLKAQGHYKDNKKQGIWRYWNNQGKKVREDQYKDDEKIAQWTFNE